jgi:hypothetical protein
VDTAVVNAALQELDGFHGPLEDVLVIISAEKSDYVHSSRGGQKWMTLEQLFSILF